VTRPLERLSLEEPATSENLSLVPGKRVPRVRERTFAPPPVSAAQIRSTATAGNAPFQSLSIRLGRLSWMVIGAPRPVMCIGAS
jgi:hypothetical protein